MLGMAKVDKLYRTQPRAERKTPTNALLLFLQKKKNFRSISDTLFLSLSILLSMTRHQTEHWHNGKRIALESHVNVRWSTCLALVIVTMSNFCFQQRSEGGKFHNFVPIANLHWINIRSPVERIREQCSYRLL